MGRTQGRTGGHVPCHWGIPQWHGFFSAGLCAAGVGSGFLAYARRKPGSIGTVPSAPNLGVAVNGLGQGVGFAGKEYR